MRKSIILGNFVDYKLSETFEGERDFFHFRELDKAFRFHLDHADIDSYIIETVDFTEKQLINITKNIYFLNQMVSVFLLDFNEDKNLDINKRVRVISDLSELEQTLKDIKHGGREFNRVKWPLSVSLHEENNIHNRCKGLVLSLSVGGCLIRVEEQKEEFCDKRLILTFRFKDFDFLVEGEVVRKNKDEIAVKFLKITPFTASYLKEIIDNEILSELVGI